MQDATESAYVSSSEAFCDFASENTRPTLDAMGPVETALRKELPHLQDIRTAPTKWKSKSELTIGTLALIAREMVRHEVVRNPASELVPVVRERFRVLAQELYDQTNGCNTEIESLLQVIEASHNYECPEPEHDEHQFLMNPSDFGLRANCASQQLWPRQENVESNLHPKTL